jgi:hypothetical protein
VIGTKRACWFGQWRESPRDSQRMPTGFRQGREGVFAKGFEIGAGLKQLDKDYSDATDPDGDGDGVSDVLPGDEGLG